MSTCYVDNVGGFRRGLLVVTPRLINNDTNKTEKQYTQYGSNN